MACDNPLALLTVFTQEPSEPLLKSQFNSDTYYKSQALQLTIKSRLINHYVTL